MFLGVFGWLFFFWPTCQVRVSRFDVSLSFLLFLSLLSSFLSSLPSCQAHSQRHRQLPRQPPLHRHSIASSPALLGPGGPEHYVTMPDKMSDGMSMSEHMPEKMRYNMSHTQMSIYDSRSKWLKTILVLQKFFVRGVHESSNYWDLKDFDGSSYANSWWGHSKKGSLFSFLTKGRQQPR